MEKEHSFDRLLGDSAVFVLLITAFSFLSTLAMHSGYCDYFNVPKTLIKIDGRVIAIWLNNFGSYVLCFSAFEILLSSFLKPLFEKYNAKVRGEQYFNYLLFIYSSLLLYLFLLLKKTKLLFCISIVFALISLCVFIATHRKFMKTDEGFLKLGFEDEEPMLKTDYSITLRLLGRKVFLFIICSSLLVSVSMDFGIKYGQEQDVFFKVNNRSDIVGICIYDDILIAKKISDLDSFELISISNGCLLTVEKSATYKTLFNEDYLRRNHGKEKGTVQRGSEENDSELGILLEENLAIVNEQIVDEEAKETHQSIIVELCDDSELYNPDEEEDLTRN